MNTRRIILSLFLFLASWSLQAQVPYPTPIKWSYEATRVAPNVYDLAFTAKLDKGWHIYSQFITGEGPVATAFTFKKSDAYSLVGKVKEEGKLIQEHDPNFDMDLKYFMNSVKFIQRVELKKQIKKVSGTYEYMVCNEQMCLPPERDVEFSFDLNAKQGVKLDPVNLEPAPLDKQPVPNPDTVRQQQKKGSGSIVTPQNDQGNGSSGKIQPKPADQPVESTLDVSKQTLGSLFLLGILNGLIALFTPCVFPMIPLTVSFFTKQSGDKSKGIGNALIFGISIILIYEVLGLVGSIVFGPAALNNLASDAVFNIFCFLVFVIFAFSFLGAFEISLPSSWANKADSVSEKGGIIGIFFVALTLTIVSFSCTSIFAGSILLLASKGGYIGPIIGMLGFSLAFALPFTLFAIFPSWMQSLPKSGGWLNAVKVVLGLIELAMAMKFLSAVDLAYHWGMLKREYFLAIWIIIFALMGFYMLGKLRFSHDSPLQHISVPRLVLAIFAFSFSAYMVPGLWGAPVKLLSGLAPPYSYNDGFVGAMTSESVPGNPSDIRPTKYTDIFEKPHGINAFFDYEEALSAARKEGKPLMIDFTGWSCVNCRKMEDNVWVDPEAMHRLKNDYVLVQLFVDDRTSLPNDQVYESPVTKKKVNTLGRKWYDFQISRFGRSAQPWYVILDNQENKLVESNGYNPNVEAFIEFLDKGKDEFKKKQSHPEGVAIAN